MRKIVISGSAGQCGTDFWEFYEVSEDATDEELSDLAWQCALANAEMYGIYHTPDYQDSEELTDEELDSDQYSEDIDGGYEDYDPEKHDGHTMTGVPKWN